MTKTEYFFKLSDFKYLRKLYLAPGVLQVKFNNYKVGYIFKVCILRFYYQ